MKYIALLIHSFSSGSQIWDCSLDVAHWFCLKIQITWQANFLNLLHLQWWYSSLWMWYIMALVWWCSLWWCSLYPVFSVCTWSRHPKVPDLLFYAQVSRWLHRWLVGERVSTQNPRHLPGVPPWRATDDSSPGQAVQCRWSRRHGYGSIPIDTFLMGWTSIYQLFWGSLGTRVLTHSHIVSTAVWGCQTYTSQVFSGQTDHVLILLEILSSSVQPATKAQDFGAGNLSSIFQQIYGTPLAVWASHRCSFLMLLQCNGRSWKRSTYFNDMSNMLSLMLEGMLVKNF